MKTLAPLAPPTPAFDWTALKARQKATWESGDFGEIARCIVPAAEEFMQALPMRAGLRLLDLACGTGNLAILAARRGCLTHGVDIATNLLAQARVRSAQEGVLIDYTEGDAEALPYADETFDAVVSMFGAMFAPRPGIVASEIHRVLRPGGFMAMANWTPEGFIGRMFEVFRAHVPPPPKEVPSTLLWGQEATVRERLGEFANLRLTRRIAVMRHPFSPADTVDFFRRYYGPTHKAFESLPPEGQSRLRRDLVDLQVRNNRSGRADTTEMHAEYLEVLAFRP